MEERTGKNNYYCYGINSYSINSVIPTILTNWVIKERLAREEEELKREKEEREKPTFTVSLKWFSLSSSFLAHFQIII